MAGYSAGHAELVQAASDMADGNAQLQSELKQLAMACDAVQGAWKGQAQAAFQQLMVRFQEDSKKLNDSLMNISDAVSGSAQDYEQQEEQAAQDVSAITNALG